MPYEQLMFIHLWTVIPAFFLGTYMLMARKGTRSHVILGRVYMILMLITATVSLFMPARLGSTLWNHFGYIHLFSILTIWAVPRGYIAIKKKDVKAHKRSMIMLYFGALVIAGAFTFVPGRYMHSVFFGG